MADEQLIEPPGYGTAGLASALQITDQTGFPVFMPTHSTSIAPSLVAWQQPPNLARQALVRTPPREERFEMAMRDSLRENSEILRELAKY